MLFVAISIATAVLSHKLYLFQTLDHFATIRKGHVIDLLWSIPIAIFFHVYESSAHKVLDPWINDNFIRLDRYTDEKARQRRVPALSKMVYSMAYYLISSVCGYFVIKDTTMIPAWLGGRGQCANAYLNAPHLTEDTLGMQIYILVTFSKDLNRLVTHALIKPEGNYYEYLLHHGLATFLILFSYLSNFWVIGAFIIFIHDFSDLALSAGRFYGDYRHNQTLFINLLYVYAVPSWIGCRIIIHLGCCCWPVFGVFKVFSTTLNEVEMEVMYLPMVFMSFMMYALEVMHLFWTYYIIRGAIQNSKSQKKVNPNYI